MKLHRKLTRRRFLQEGFLWGGVAVIFTLLGRRLVTPSAQAIRPVRARHYRHLAG